MSIETMAEDIAPPQAPQGGTVRRELLENERVLVIESIYPPGGSVPEHTHHSPHVVYVVEGGTLETTSADGTVETHLVRPGETLWRKAPQSHRTRNVGDTRVRIVEIEVKVPASTKG